MARILLDNGTKVINRLLSKMEVATRPESECFVWRLYVKSKV